MYYSSISTKRSTVSIGTSVDDLSYLENEIIIPTAHLTSSPPTWNRPLHLPSSAPMVGVDRYSYDSAKNTATDDRVMTSGSVGVPLLIDVSNSRKRVGSPAS